MFCLRQNKPALLVWYKNPISVAHEMRPPAIQLWEDLALHRRNIGDPFFTLITREKKEDQFKVSRGPVRVQPDGKAVFEDVENENTLSFLDFKSCSPKNTRILKRALAASEQTFVPDFDPSNKTLVEGSELPQDEFWVGALAISRAELTQFLISYMLAGLDTKKKAELVQRGPQVNVKKLVANKVLPKHDSCLLFSWYPTAKPASLENWLKELHDGLSEDGIAKVHNELSPLIEGFYRVAPVRRDSTDKSEITIMYDDDTFMTSAAYFDRGEKSKDHDSRFMRPNDIHRGKLTISTPLCISTSDDTNLDWGFSGLTPLGWLFLVPMRAGKNRKYVMGPVRVPLSGLTRFRTEVVKERKEHFNSEGVRAATEDVYKPLIIDAELNLSDMPSSTFLTNPSKEEKAAIRLGIQKTFVAPELTPSPPEPLRGKTISMPRRLMVPADPSESESGSEDDGVFGSGAQDEKKMSEAPEVCNDGDRQDAASKEGEEEASEAANVSTQTVVETPAPPSPASRAQETERPTVDDNADGGEVASEAQNKPRTSKARSVAIEKDTKAHESPPSAPPPLESSRVQSSANGDGPDPASGAQDEPKTSKASNDGAKTDAEAQASPSPASLPRKSATAHPGGNGDGQDPASRVQDDPKTLNARNGGAQTEAEAQTSSSPASSPRKSATPHPGGNGDGPDPASGAQDEPNTSKARKDGAQTEPEAQASPSPAPLPRKSATPHPGRNGEGPDHASGAQDKPMTSEALNAGVEKVAEDGASTSPVPGPGDSATPTSGGPNFLCGPVIPLSPNAVDYEDGEDVSPSSASSPIVAEESATIPKAVAGSSDATGAAKKDPPAQEDQAAGEDSSSSKRGAPAQRKSIRKRRKTQR